MRKFKILAIVALTSMFVGVIGTVIYMDRSDARLKEIERLKEVVARMQGERRIAEVVVVHQEKDPTTRRLRTTFRFSEVTPDGEALAAREYTIDGDVAYFDALVVKFDHQYVELGDALRGKSLYLFRRTFGEFQEPSKGFPLDETRPSPYRLHPQPSAFEQEIWREFWKYATDADYASTKGVRVAFGEAVYTKLQPGKIYRLSIENAGGMNLRSENLPPVLKGNPSR
jgi:hypothetical protein